MANKHIIIALLALHLDLRAMIMVMTKGQEDLTPKDTLAAADRLVDMASKSTRDEDEVPDEYQPPMKEEWIDDAQPEGAEEESWDSGIDRLEQELRSRFVEPEPEPEVRSRPRRPRSPAQPEHRSDEDSGMIRRFSDPLAAAYSDQPARQTQRQPSDGEDSD